VLAVGGALFLAGFRQFHRDGTDAAAVRAFFTSNTFLALLFVAWGVGGATGGVGPVGQLLAGALTAGTFAWLWTRRPALDGVTSAPAAEADWVAARLGRAAEYVRDNAHRPSPSNSD